MINILVIDDQPRKVVEYTKFDKTKFNVVFADTFRGARTTLIENKLFFDQIIIDYHLDERRNGVELLYFIKNDNRRRNTLKDSVQFLPNSSDKDKNELLSNTILEYGWKLLS